MKRRTEMVFEFSGGELTAFEALRVKTDDEAIVFEQDSGSVELPREGLAELLRQVIEWEAGEPAARGEQS